MGKFEFRGIMFDDVADNGVNKWSRICKSCVDKYNIEHNLLDEAGQGICGVEGCNNEVDFYIDFPEKVILSWD